MKIINFTVLFLLFLPVFGQTSYTSQNYASQGSGYTLSRYSGINLNMMPIAATGENKTWNFAQIGLTNQLDKSFTNPDLTGYRESFVASCVLNGGGFFNCLSQWYLLCNLASPIANSIDLWQVQLNNVVEFQKKSTDNLKTNILGASISKDGINMPLTLSYTQPDIVYQFPINYSNKDTSISSYGIDLYPYQINVVYQNHQKRVNFVDGWGKLITPYKTFNNVLRMKTTIEHSDTTLYNGQVYPINTTEIIYSWFDPEFKCPVLQVKGYIQANIQIFNEALYIDTTHCLNPQLSAISLPITSIIDPNTGTCDIHFMNFSLNCNQYFWNFGDNSEISNLQNPNHSYNSDGVYQVKLKGCNTICSPVQCDSIGLIVTITDTTKTYASFFYQPQQACPGDSVTFFSTSINSNQLKWFINNNIVSQDQSFTMPFDTNGYYNVTLVAENNYDTDTASNQILIEPIPWAYAGPDTSIYIGDTIQLNASGPSGAMFSWSPNQHLSCIFCQNPLAYPKTSTSYFLNVENICGQAYDTITVFVDSTNIIQKLPTEKKFSINISNDYITIKPIDDQNNNFNVSIFDNSGKKIKEIKNTNPELKLQTKQFKTGFYIFQLKLKKGDNLVFKWIKS